MVPLEVVLCYAHEDEKLSQLLAKHLGVFRRSEKITLWHDQDAISDAEKQQEIEMHFNSAHIILLLLSPDFLASDHCYIEMKKALEKHKAGTVRVMPILARYVNVARLPSQELPIFPANGQAVSRWPDQEEALVEIAIALGNAIDEVRSAMKHLATDQEDDQQQNPHPGMGTLIVHANKALLGKTIELHEGTLAKSKFHSYADVVARKVGETTVYQAVFEALKPGDYIVLSRWQYLQNVFLFTNRVLEIDWTKGSPASMP